MDVQVTSSQLVDALSVLENSATRNSPSEKAALSTLAKHLKEHREAAKSYAARMYWNVPRERLTSKELADDFFRFTASNYIVDPKDQLQPRKIQQNPLISVIVTSYNDASVVERAIQSATNQTYKNTEVVLVASTPNEKIVTEYEKIAQRYGIKSKIEHGRLSGSQARNIGISLSTGDFVSFLDDDDEFFAEKIQRQVECAQANPEIHLIYCGIENRTSTGVIKLWNNSYEGDLRRFILERDGEIRICSSVLFCSRELVNVCRFDEAYARHQDYEFLLRANKHTYIKYISDPLIRKHTISRFVPNGRPILDIKKIFLEKNRTLIEQFSEEIRKFIYFTHTEEALTYLLKGDRIQDTLHSFWLATKVPGLRMKKRMLNHVFGKTSFGQKFKSLKKRTKKKLKQLT